jgi:hypothetical protein
VIPLSRDNEFGVDCRGLRRASAKSFSQVDSTLDVPNFNPTYPFPQGCDDFFKAGLGSDARVDKITGIDRLLTGCGVWFQTSEPLD